MGIPKSEGMYQTPKIPANPSFVELDEDENAVEKFKKAMSSISNVLALDRLKQVGARPRAPELRWGCPPQSPRAPVGVPAPEPPSSGGGARLRAPELRWGCPPQSPRAPVGVPAPDPPSSGGGARPGAPELQWGCPPQSPRAPVGVPAPEPPSSSGSARPRAPELRWGCPPQSPRAPVGVPAPEPPSSGGSVLWWQAAAHPLLPLAGGGSEGEAGRHRQGPEEEIQHPADVAAFWGLCTSHSKTCRFDGLCCLKAVINGIS